MNITRRSFVTSAAMASGVFASMWLFGCTNSSGANQAASDAAGTLPANEAVFNDTDRLRQTVDGLIGSMTLEDKIAQLFVVRPEGVLCMGQTKCGTSTYEPITEIDNDVREAIAEAPVGGFTLFGDNLVSPDQATEFIKGLRQCSMDSGGVIPLLCVDEEGGTVSRIANNSAFNVQNVGDMADVGVSGDVSAAMDIAKEIAGYLEPLGFNTDFAPVADVANNPESQVMKERSFGADATAVANMVAAQVEGFEDAQMMCCLKHFPGLGAAVGDSHKSQITIEKTADELAECELIPFEAGIDAGAPMVMVGHLSVPNIVGDETPASLASDVVTGLLRNKLGFDGVVITDSMEMGAIADYYSSDEAAVQAIQAGCDLVLMPMSLNSAYSAVYDAVQSGEITEDRIDESLRRIFTMKGTYIEGWVI